MRALVIGDGPAGLLAAVVLRQAGARVTISRKGANANDQHVHFISPDLADLASSIDPKLGKSLRAEIQEPWLWHSWNGDAWHGETAPRLSRSGVMSALWQMCRDIPLQSLRDGDLRFDLDAGRFADCRNRYDLCIDASGNSRVTLPLLTGAGYSAELDEIGQPSFSVSWQYARPEQITAGQSWIYRDQGGSKPSCYLESDAKTLHLTCAGYNRAGGHKSLEDAWGATPLADILSKAADAKARHALVSPPVRHLRLGGVASGPSPAWIAFGDALLQMPAQSGLGIRSLFLQGQVLKALLETTRDPGRLRTGLANFSQAAAVQIAGAMTLSGEQSAGTISWKDLRSTC